jgi:hypothetical protein
MQRHSGEYDTRDPWLGIRSRPRTVGLCRLAAPKRKGNSFWFSAARDQCLIRCLSPRGQIELFTNFVSSAILTSDLFAKGPHMRRTKLTLIFLMLSYVTLQAENKVPEAMQKRLIAFTDQLWATWMKSGDIRSIALLRIPEVLNDPACALVIFTDEKTCKGIDREERADYAQTVDNVTTLMIYRILSHQHVFDWIGSLDKANADPSLAEVFKSASLSSAELSVLKDLEGTAKDNSEFRRRLPRYKQLEQMLQEDHLKDFSRSENQEQFKQNIALLDQAFKDTVVISKIDQPRIADGMPPGGDYYMVPKGMFFFVVRLKDDEMKLAFAQMLTK